MFRNQGYEYYDNYEYLVPASKGADFKNFPGKFIEVQINNSMYFVNTGIFKKCSDDNNRNYGWYDIDSFTTDEVKLCENIFTEQRELKEKQKVKIK